MKKKSGGPSPCCTETKLAGIPEACPKSTTKLPRHHPFPIGDIALGQCSLQRLCRTLGIRNEESLEFPTALLEELRHARDRTEGKILGLWSFLPHQAIVLIE